MPQEQVPIVVAVVLNQERKLLVAKRKEPDVPDADGKWEFVGGHIEFNEDPEDAVIREVKEESGLDVKVKRLLPKIYSNCWRTKDGKELHVLLLNYECEIIGGQLHTSNFDQKISELKFVDFEEFNSLDLLPMAKEIADLLNL